LGSITVANELDTESKRSTSPIGVVAGVIAGVVLIAIAAILLGLLARHHRYVMSENAKEMTCESGEEDEICSDDYEGDIFDMEAEKGGKKDGRSLAFTVESTDSRAEWQEFGIHGGEDSNSYFDDE
jgi:hypothetical protein